MVNDKNFEKGFDLTDTDANGKITLAEDNNANLLANRFDKLDTYTIPLSTSKPKDTPD